tara:strand:+ start:2933 stop:4933 length:2001 start_codon:yes stop_codon:yes gene_type:complete
MVNFTVNAVNQSVTGNALTLSAKAGENDLSLLPRLDLEMLAINFNDIFLIGPDNRNATYADFTNLAAENMYYKTRSAQLHDLIGASGTNSGLNVSNGTLSGNLLIEELDGDLTIAAYTLRKFANDIFGLENLSDVFGNAGTFKTNLNTDISTANGGALMGTIKSSIDLGNNMTNEGLMPGTYLSTDATISCTVTGTGASLPAVDWIYVDSSNRVNVKLSSAGSGIVVGDTLNFTIGGVPVASITLASGDFSTGSLITASELETEVTATNSGDADVNSIATGTYSTGLGVTITYSSRTAPTITKVVVDSNAAVTEIVGNGDGAGLIAGDILNINVGNIALGDFILVAGNLNSGALLSNTDDMISTQGATAPTNSGSKVVANISRQLLLQLAESEGGSTRLTDDDMFALANIQPFTTAYTNTNSIDDATYYNAVLSFETDNNSANGQDGAVIRYMKVDSGQVTEIRFETAGNAGTRETGETLTFTINGVQVTGTLQLTTDHVDNDNVTYINNGELVTTAITGLTLTATGIANGIYCGVLNDGTEGISTATNVSGTGAKVDAVLISSGTPYIRMANGGRGYANGDAFVITISSPILSGSLSTTPTALTGGGLATADLTEDGAVLAYYKFKFIATDTLNFKLTVNPHSVPLRLTDNEASAQDYCIRITMA